MDLGVFADSIILLISGTLILLYGLGKLFRTVSDKDEGLRDKKSNVIAIGVVLILASITQIFRQLY